MARLGELAATTNASPEIIELVRHWYEDRVQDRIRGLQRHDGRSDPQTQMPSQEGELLLDAIAAERRHLVQLRDQGVISDQVVRRVGHELDLEEMRIRNDMLPPEENA